MKSDLKKQISGYTASRGRFDVVSVPELQFLLIDGHGDPNASQDYAAALATIYPVAYTLKFASRNDLGRDYSVMPLEALWWADDMDSFTGARDKSRWNWTLMNLIPDWITDDSFERAREKVAAKGAAPALDILRMERFAEGLCVQTLHIGAYDDEAPVLRTMHDEIIPARGLRMTGKHHEIYLNDPRRTSPDRLRTILRQPVARTG